MDVTSPAIVNEIRAALVRSFAPVSLDILDDSARHAGHAGARAGGHFRVTLVSTAFAGRSALERHRMVYRALEPLMGHGIHALNISARAPEAASRPAI
jgi:BolA protein